jgi:hypothetical protein
MQGNFNIYTTLLYIRYVIHITAFVYSITRDAQNIIKINISILGTRKTLKFDLLTQKYFKNIILINKTQN